MDDKLAQENSNTQGTDVESALLIGEIQTPVDTVDDLPEKEEPTEPSTPLLIYKISDNPPIHMTIIFAFQQALLSFANQLALSLLVAQVVCGEHLPILRTNLLSSTLFMNGFTTFVMCFFGVRLPLFQGGSYEYIVPLVALQEINPDRCNVTMFKNTASFTNESALQFLSNSTLMNGTTNDFNTMTQVNNDFIYHNIQTMMGSLMVAGAIHCLIGATGLIGILLRFIGPVTIVPAILLIGLYMFKVVVRFTSVHWGTGLMTCGVSLILALYLGKWKMPLPFWTRTKGFHVIRSQFHQTAAILIALLFGWVVSAVMTACGAFSDDPGAPDYYARTDVLTDVISNAEWFYFPHPGQFGLPAFSGSALIGFLIATLISILDSIGDYYACARTCQVPPPPSHAVNRGIAVEGFCSFLSGTVGCGHATSTYGGNIGAIGLTKVASRRVFMIVGILYMLFGILGKFSAIFITIPQPVLGGTLITMIGMFTGVVLSNLQFVKLTSTRNLAVIGISLIVGLMVPYWIEKNPNNIKTGNTNLDQLIRMALGNANLAGALTACILDNTIPGSREERGFTAWEYVTSKKDTEKSDNDEGRGGTAYMEGLEVYEPLLPRAVRRWKGLKYFPFMPDAHLDSETGHEIKDQNSDGISLTKC